MKTKKIILIILFFSASILTIGAQTSTEPKYKIVGDEIVRINKKSVSAAQKTKLIHKVKNKVYPVWKTKRGKYYILRTSKKTNKQYKQYLKIK